MSRRIYATHRITTVPLGGWDTEHARFLDLRAGRVPDRTGLASFALSLLRSLSQRRSSLAQGEQ